MTKKLFYLLFSVLLVVLFTGCPNGSGGTIVGTDNSFSRFDTEGALALMEGKSANNSNGRYITGDDGSGSFYKCTEAGFVSVIQYLDEEGEVVELYEYPSKMVVIDDTYSILYFTSQSVLVDNETGRAREINNVPVDFETYSALRVFSNDIAIKRYDDKLYFVTTRYSSSTSERNYVNEYDISGDEVVFTDNRTNILDNVNVDTFAVNSKGAMIYREEIMNSYSVDHETIIIEADGNRVEMFSHDIDSPLPYSNWTYWTNDEDKLCLMFHESEKDGSNSMHFYVFDDNGYPSSTTTVYNAEELSVNSYLYVFDGFTLRVDENKGVKVNDGSYTLENLEGLPTEYAFNDAEPIIAKTPEYLFMGFGEGGGDPLMTTKLYLYDVYKDSNELVSSYEYEFYHITGNKNNTATFSGRRTADGVEVVGVIDWDGYIEIIDEDRGYSQIDSVNQYY